MIFAESLTGGAIDVIAERIEPFDRLRMTARGSRIEDV